MASTLEPNRIHTLPVQIQYHLPYSSHTFTTILPNLQQVYIYPAAPGEKGSQAESWGSIYLKTVVQGVVMASPEVLPFGSDVPDLSLYIFDPRETFLRKSRPAHLRPQRPSSPLPGQSPNLGVAGESEQAVWTGKGLVSWALNEAGLGKNLITGRLVKSPEFARHAGERDGVDPLHALLSGQEDTESWGIEVSLGLKDATSGTLGFAPTNGQVQYPAISRQASPAIPVASPIVPHHHATPSGHQFQRPSHPAVPRRSLPTPQHTPTAGPSVPTPQRRQPASTPARPTQPPPAQSTRTKAVPTTKKKRPAPPSRHLASVDTNSTKHGSGSRARQTEGNPTPVVQGNLPFEIPRHVYDNPDLLTKEQAERLIASPLFLDKISQMTGHPLVPKVKREREEEGSLGSAKKPRFSRTDADGESISKCYNCGRVKSYVWRQMTLDDGNVVTICNACGLYKNRHGHMRPPSMWEGVEDEVKSLRLGGKTPFTSSAGGAHPSSDIDMPATRLDSVFKRTLSAAVDKDAERIASSRKPPIPRPTQMNKITTRSAPGPMAMTSPPRGSASAAKGVRNTSRTFETRPAASSPGGYALPASDADAELDMPSSQHQQVTKVGQEHMEFDPNESPNTAISRILGTNMPLQSLEMPLSDDGREQANTSGTGHGQGLDWTTTDISTYFDVGNFEMSAGPHGARALRSPSPPPPFHRTSSSAASKRRAYTHHQPSESNEEDDVLSQLFNRTSSIGPLDSSPAPFDFSQLPPSSPPASTHGPSSDIDLGHSHLLLSSPSSVSPLGVSPMDRNGNRVSPDKKSGLKHSFTPQYQDQQMELGVGEPKSAPPEYQFEDIWSSFQTGGLDMMSSGQVAETLLGGGAGTGGVGYQTGSQVESDTDDFMALFNSLTNA